MTSLKMNKDDFFRVLIEKGILKTSGLDGFTPYRILEYKGKNFKLILKEKK